MPYRQNNRKQNIDKILLDSSNAFKFPLFLVLSLDFSPLFTLFMVTGISFTPKEVGEHEVSVRKNGMHVANSPFKIMVGQSEIGEASRVKAFGKGLVEAHTFEMAEFFVDTRNAGKL